MKPKTFLILILASFSISLLTITSLHATAFFEFNGESGYQYMGSGNAHPGGGYFSYMGGNVAGAAGTLPVAPNSCASAALDTAHVHYAILSNDAAAQGSVPGSQWSIKTPYTANCTDESYPRDTTIITIPQLSEFYIRWYQKFTGDWPNCSMQHKFFKPSDSINGSSCNPCPGQFTFNIGGAYGNVWRAYPMPDTNGHFNKDGINRYSYCFVFATWEAMHALGMDYPGTTASYDDDASTTSEFHFQTNTWYCIEIHVKINTAGNYDGMLEAWVNGTKVFGVYKYMWYSGTPAKVTAFEMQHIWYNRNAIDSPTYMDNIVISDQYIGPAGPPISAPSPPQGLRIIP